MAHDKGDTWDLSLNDQAALLAVYRSHADLYSALLVASRDIPAPFETSMCHVGITTMDKCARCSRAMKIYAAIARVEGRL
jgi:hypothetical protein